jgi:outer membrane protein assembly factor BamB
MKTRKQLFSAFFLALIMIAAMMFISNAPTTMGKQPAAAYVYATPAKIGVGETIYIVGWISPQPAVQRARYYNFTFTITKPDKTTELVLVDQSNVEGTTSFSYVCTMNGTWKVVLSWGGDALREGAVSSAYAWTVEQGYSPTAWPSEPLPTGAWSWPISAEYYEWYQISGGWLGSNYNASNANFNPFTKGPDSSHVLWKYQGGIGGLMGGEWGYYDSRGSPTTPVAFQGRLYYTTTEGFGSSVYPLLHVLDSFTGKEIFAKALPSNSTYPGRGGTLQFELHPREKEGVESVSGTSQVISLWVSGGGLWEVNPWDGNTLYYWVNGPSGLYADGAMYFNGYNTTKGASQALMTSKWDTRAKTTVYTINATIDRVWGDILMDRRAYAPEPGIAVQAGIVAFWTYDAKTGNQIAYIDTKMTSSVASGADSVGYGCVFMHYVDRSVHAYSLTTGREVWASDEAESPWGVFSAYSSTVGYDMVYDGNYDGHLYAYNAKTGKTEWSYYSGSTTETAFGTYPWWGKIVAGGGKVYAATGEHTPPDPLPRGNKLYALDAYTGDLVWSISFMSGGGLIADGKLYYSNAYDGCVYCFDKGSTTTAVSVPQTVVPMGNSVLIQGSVTDQSPGSKGTPAISDESMSAWMEYLHMNKQMPTNATGVTVFLQAMLSNGTVIDIWHAKSDIMGHYEYTWTPPTADTYKIFATFEGSNSYYSSSGETALSVGQAASTVYVPSASEVANQVISQLPTPVPATPSPAAIVTPTPYTASDIAQQVLYQLPAISSTDAILIAAVALVAVLGIATLLSVRKIKKT